MEKKKIMSSGLQRVILLILFLVLVFWSLPLVNKGIDLRDTGSYLTKYRYIFNRDIRVNELHYFLGEVAGGIIYALAPVRKVLALNVASSILYVLTALLLYLGLRSYLPKIPLMACALTGTFYGITWIRTLNWNAWTALWLTVGLLLLLGGLGRGDQRLLALSGFVLAINTYFRFPNMLFLALIAVVFWKELLDILAEEQGRIQSLIRPGALWRAVKSCRWFFAGAVAGAAVGLLLALVILGPETVLRDLGMLTSVGAGENEGNTHSITTGIYLFLLGMRSGAVSWVKYGVILAGICLLLTAVQALFQTNEKACGVCFTAGMVSAGLLGLFPGLFGDILAAHEWVAFGSIVFGIAGACCYGRKDRMLSCLCAAAVIIEGFLTIGTDTGVNYYRVYMGLPLALLMILAYRYKMDRPQDRNCRGFGLLIRMLAVFTFVFVTAAGIRYAVIHVYHDAPNAELTEGIHHSDYTGIKTSPERAEALNRLMKELAPYEGKKLLQIGCFNIGCVLTDMEPFYDSSWPDLEYLPMETFDEQLDAAIEKGDLPVLLLGTAEESGMNWSPGKFARIRELGESSLYRVLYRDALYTIYVPEE